MSETEGEKIIVVPDIIREKKLEEIKQIEDRYKDTLREKGHSEEEIANLTRPLTPEEIQADIDRSKAHQAKMAEANQRIQALDEQEKKLKQGFRLPFFRKK